MNVFVPHRCMAADLSGSPRHGGRSRAGTRSHGSVAPPGGGGAPGPRA